MKLLPGYNYGTDRDVLAFYRTLSYFSDYGPHFRRVTNVYYGYREALVAIRGLDEELER